MRSRSTRRRFCATKGGHEWLPVFEAKWIQRLANHRHTASSEPRLVTGQPVPAASRSNPWTKAPSRPQMLSTLDRWRDK